MNFSTTIKYYLRIGLIVSILTVPTFSFAQITKSKPNKPQAQTTRILFLFDGSQSMFGRWQSGMKIDIAQKLLSKLVDSLRTNDNLQLALRAYGHQFAVSSGGRNCHDTKLEIPFSKNNHDALIKRIGEIRPRGTTPIAYSLLQAANDFPPCEDCKNIIILITDGIEECDGDPCTVSDALQKKSITLKPFIIGIGLIGENLKRQFDCVGSFYDAESEQGFSNILSVVISQAMDNTTAQVNLMDANGKPTETDVNVTFYDQNSGKIKYNFIHTLNDRGYPDTLFLDPSIKYKIVAHTIPSVSVEKIEINAGKHTIIPIDVPQGELELRIINEKNQSQNLKAIVRKKGEQKTLNYQTFDTKEKYLIGKYDLEIFTLPRLYIDDVTITQSYTTKVEIPLAGIITFALPSSGFGGVYQLINNELKMVVEFNEFEQKESFTLQPGNYTAVYRPKKSRSSKYTSEVSFTVESGKSKYIKF